MGRKRIEETPALKSWEDVDKSLREIAEAEIAIQDIESDMQKQILGIQKIAEQNSKPHADRIAKLERDIKEFVTDHRDELGKAKSKVLNFGEVGFRMSTKITLPKSQDKLNEIIRKLKARKMNDCIVVKETISRDKLKSYGEEKVNAVGAKWKQKDTFGYDVYLTKLERINSGVM